ncbi:MAG: hypothetical protein RLZZ416_488 [Candidatus Parcubacteria bacterium]|jgi:TrpR-related protein YerC/YecD
MMDWRAPQNRALIKALLELKNEAEARHFLRDLMTESEIEEFAKRLQTAHLLAEDVPYSQIALRTGLSSTTIARVSKWLHGKEGGYRMVLHRLHSKANSSS